MLRRLKSVNKLLLKIFFKIRITHFGVDFCIFKIDIIFHTEMTSESSDFENLVYKPNQIVVNNINPERISSATTMIHIT
jgi:hypothetical protein